MVILYSTSIEPNESEIFFDKLSYFLKYLKKILLERVQLFDERHESEFQFSLNQLTLSLIRCLQDAL